MSLVKPSPRSFRTQANYLSSTMLDFFVGEMNSDKSTAARDKCEHARSESKIEVEGQVLREDAADDDDKFLVGVCGLFGRHVVVIENGMDSAVEGSCLCTVYSADGNKDRCRSMMINRFNQSYQAVVASSSGRKICIFTPSYLNGLVMRQQEIYNVSYH